LSYMKNANNANTIPPSTSASGQPCLVRAVAAGHEGE
jgi:hypothetical protein